jgi:protein tyrosine phosphatase
VEGRDEVGREIKVCHGVYFRIIVFRRYLLGTVLACPISKSRDALKNSRLKIHALNLRRQDSQGPEVKLHHFRPNFWSAVDALNVKKMVSSASQYHSNDCGYINILRVI